MEVPGQKKEQGALIAAIVFASIVVSGSLVFLGLQMSGNGLSANIAAGEGSDAEIQKLIEELKKGGAMEEQAPTITASKEELFDDDAIMGNKNADVALIEFSDYQCPFCHRHYEQTMPLIKKDYIDTGKITYVFRDYPLSFHADAVPAAIAAECAREQQGDSMYFRMHEKIFGEVSLTGTIPEENLTRYAQELGLNASSFDTCMNSLERRNEVNADIAAGNSYGISGTPGFIITDGDTSRFISGAQPYAVFQQELDAMLQ